MKYLIFFTSLLVLFFSCQNANKRIGESNSDLCIQDIKGFIHNYDSIIELKIDCDETFIKAEQILSTDVKFVKLETNSECLIGRIDKILFDDEKIFIVDRSISKSVFIFDFNGVYLGKISNQGRGPGEFIKIQDVVLNKHMKELHLLDAFGRKINQYNYNGEFLKEMKTSVIFHSFEYLNWNTSIRYKNREFSPEIPAIQLASLYSITDNKLFSYGFEEALAQENFSWSTLRQLWKYREDIFYNSRFSDTIYRVSEDTVWGAYSLNMLGYNIPAKDKKHLTNEKFEILSKKYGYLNGDFIDLKDFVFLKLYLPGFPVFSLYSKGTNRIISGREIRVHQHPLLIFFKSQSTHYFNGNTVVEVVDPRIIKFYKWEDCDVKNEFPEMETVFARLNDGIDIYSNPVLFFYEFKEF
jgi:hypothetical protein